MSTRKGGYGKVAKGTAWLNHNMAKAIDRRTKDGAVQTVPSMVKVSKAPNGALVFSLGSKRKIRHTTKQWVTI